MAKKKRFVVKTISKNHFQVVNTLTGKYVTGHTKETDAQTEADKRNAKLAAPKAPKSIKACKTVTELDAFFDAQFKKDPRQFLGMVKDMAFVFYAERAAKEDLPKGKEEAYLDPQAEGEYCIVSEDKEFDNETLDKVHEAFRNRFAK